VISYYALQIARTVLLIFCESKGFRMGAAGGAKERRKVVAYMRTSSAANLGNDRNSEKRQRVALKHSRSAPDCKAGYTE
jgi:hypothetical protein